MLNDDVVNLFKNAKDYGEKLFGHELSTVSYTHLDVYKRQKLYL